MTTVFEGLVAIAQRLPRTLRGMASNGGTVTDTETYIWLADFLQLINYEDDAFIGAVLLILSGDCEGFMLPIADSNQTAFRVEGRQVISEQLGSEVPASGDFYLLTAPLYNAGSLVLALREALQEWGLVQVEEELGTGDGTTTTFSPSGSGDVVRICLLDDDENERLLWTHWEQNSDGTVTLAIAPPEDYAVWATIARPALDGLQLPLNNVRLELDLGDIPPNFLGYLGAASCVRSALAAPGQDQDQMIKLMNYYIEQAELLRENKQMRGVRRRERFLR